MFLELPATLKRFEMKMNCISPREIQIDLRGSEGRWSNWVTTLFGLHALKCVAMHLQVSDVTFSSSAAAGRLQLTVLATTVSEEGSKNDKDWLSKEQRSSTLAQLDRAIPELQTRRKIVLCNDTTLANIISPQNANC